MRTPKNIKAREKSLRRNMVNVRKRIRYFKEKGIESPAAERLLSLYRGGLAGFYLSKNPSVAEIRETERVVKKFLAAPTSTAKGARKAMKSKRQGFERMFRGMGFEGDIEKIWNSLKGYDIDALFSAYDYDSDEAMLAIAIAAENNNLNYFLQQFTRQ